MPVPWNADDPRDRPRIEENLRAVLARIVAEATRRSAPSVAMAQAWHRRIYRGVRLPVPYYAGELRDSDPRYPELIDYEVAIGTHRGVAAAEVPAAVAAFETRMRAAVSIIDRAVPSAQTPESADQLHAVLSLCARAHGEWVRIHPFANGNGRTARLWANWCALRYGLPPFVRLRPRPEGLAYAAAAQRSMDGDHEPMVAVLATMFEERLG